VQEAGGCTDRLLMRDLLLEARRSIQGLSSAAGLVRVVRAPSLTVLPSLVEPAIDPAPSTSSDAIAS
jgi:hypothetical protein